jgi:hypothetical protein
MNGSLERGPVMSSPSSGAKVDRDGEIVATQSTCPLSGVVTGTFAVMPDARLKPGQLRKLCIICLT